MICLLNITKIFGLPELVGLTNLSQLHIDFNHNITSLPELSGLTNLSELSIASNSNLISLPELSGLTNVRYLYIWSNFNVECVSGYPEQLTIQDEWPPVCEEEVTYQVGDLAEGGIVFYVDSTDQHGLVAAMEDLGSSFNWGCWQVFRPQMELQ